MSSALIWQVIRKHNSYLVSKGGVKFSAEPGNLTNMHCASSSGLANERTVDIQPLDSGKGCQVTLKNVKNKNKPASAKLVSKLKKGKAAGLRSVNAMVGRYRRNQTKVAIARTEKIFKSQQRARKGVTYKTAKLRA